jgi:hypothetical protein
MNCTCARICQLAAYSGATTLHTVPGPTCNPVCCKGESPIPNLSLLWPDPRVPTISLDAGLFTYIQTGIHRLSQRNQYAARGADNELLPGPRCIVFLLHLTARHSSPNGTQLLSLPASRSALPRARNAGRYGSLEFRITTCFASPHLRHPGPRRAWLTVRPSR